MPVASVVAFFTSLAFMTSSAQAAPFLVVIDAGHGGSDHGTVFRAGSTLTDKTVDRIAEKTITLQLALKTAEILRARGINVKLTRTTDQDLAVPARTALANQLGASVFISIHMNSPQHHGPNPSQTRNSARAAEGIETFILNHSTDASARRLAQLEGAVLGGSPHTQRLTLTQAHPADNNNEVALILKDLQLDANLTESKRLGCLVHQNLVASTQAKDRGVKQGLFYVLLGADMPSILVEAGFLSSPKDRARVLSPQGQRQIALALASSIDAFRRPASREGHRSLSTCKVH
jgi:N-acetylmuramoyl-L-alanine amidase